MKAGLRHFLPSGWWLGMWWCRVLSGKNLCFVRCLARLDMLHSNVPVSQKRCEPVWRGAHNYYRLADERTLHKNRCIMWVFHKCSNAHRDKRVEITKNERNSLRFCYFFGWFNEHSLVAQKHIHCALDRAFLLTSRTLHEHNSTCGKHVKIMKWGKT